MMNFFKSQAKARKNTFKLVFLLILAVSSLIILTNLVVMLLLGFFNKPEITDFNSVIQNMDWATFGQIGLVVWVVVLGGSISKIVALSDGGKSIAEALGGRLVLSNSSDPKQQKLLNVVTEMAIASGTPAPPVYILQNENGINAFAAGYSPRDAVIGVTQGLVDHLSRDQLQGVIAHEFSHIFNGDMRLNIQLVGMLNGIVIIGIIGYQLLRLPFRSKTRISSRSSSGSGQFMLVIISLGFCLMVIGYIGTFFGNIIKAAVSRQREYLSDASAVQYTRNPDGIAGALKRIGGLKFGSKINGAAAAAVEISHAFFARGISGFLQSMFATHPPLEKRIRLIDPGWDGEFITHYTPTTDDKTTSRSDKKNEPSENISNLATNQGLSEAIDNIGNPTQQSIQQAHLLLASLPLNIRHTAAEPYGARAIIYTLLFDKNYSIRVKQLEHLQYHAERDVYLLTQQFMDDIDKLESQFRLPLVDMTIPVLKQMSNQQYQKFRDNVSWLMHADDKIDLMEWSLQKIMLDHLDKNFHNLPQPKVRYHNLQQLIPEIQLIISLLAIAGHRNDENTRQAFTAAIKTLGIGTSEIIKQKKVKVSSIDNALNRLQQLSQTKKQLILEACIQCVEYDQKVSTREIELLRAFSAAIDCPIPLVVE